MDRSSFTGTLLPPRRAQGRLSADILVVDDNPDAADTLALLLRLWGYRVRVALDGPAALVAVTDHPPDLVLLDIGMPRMDGYEVLRRIRQANDGDGPLVVALTGYGQESDPRALTAGFHAYLLKPVDIEVLHDLLKNCLKTR